MHSRISALGFAPTRASLLGASLLAAACSSPSAPGSFKPDSNAAVLSLSSIAATSETEAADAVYRVSFQLKETGGRSGATITGMTFTVPKGAATLVTAHTPATALRVSAGGSLDVGPVKITDPGGSSIPTASDISVDVSYTGDDGRQGVASGRGAVQRLAPATYTVSGVVSDGTSGPSGRVRNATVRVLDGPNAGRSALTDEGGNYGLDGLTAGTATLSASIAEYETVNTSISIPSNVRVDFVLRPLVRINLAGTWAGTASDSKGQMAVNWTMAQSGTSVSGTVTTQVPSDGTCNSCHRNKSGTFSGTIDGTTLAVRMFFPTGVAGDPTPACSATLAGTASDVTPDALTLFYSGEDTCEGPFLNGSVPMTRSSTTVTFQRWEKP